MVCSEKSSLNLSCMLTVERLNATKNELLVKFLKGVLKFTENGVRSTLMGFLIRNLQTCKLQPSALLLFKTPEITSSEELLS